MVPIEAAAPPPADGQIAALAPPPEQAPRNWQLAAEALVAVSGIFPEEPLTPAQGAKAEKIGKVIHDEAAKFCKFGPFEDFVMPPVRDFEEVFSKLAPLTPEETQMATEGLAEPDLVEAYIAVVDGARSYLKMRWPVQVRETPTGPDWVPPSKTAGGEALTSLAVLDHPGPVLLLQEMNRGTMTPSMVEAVKAVYPLLFDAIKASFTAALLEAGAKKRRCPWRHELLVRMLFELAPTGLVTFPAEAKEGGSQLAGVDIAFGGGDMKTRNQGLK